MLLKYFKSDAKGLTVIECTISMLILAVVIAGGLKLYSNASVIMSLAMHKKMALEMAVQEMEEIKKAGYDALPKTKPPLDDWVPLPDKTFGSSTTQPFTAQMRRKITDMTASPNSLKKVELQVKIDPDVLWTEEDSNSKIFKLETFISKPKS